MYGFWRILVQKGKSHPFKLGVTVATVKTGGADLCAQLVIERRDELDWKRFACFTGLGFCYAGVFQQWFYVSILTGLFPHAKRFAELPTLRMRLADTDGLKDLVKQTLLINFGVCPVFYPFFYVFQDYAQNISPHLDTPSRVSEALGRWIANAKTDYFVMWGMWLPGHLITFAVPLWIRMPLTHSISFLFFVTLSILRGKLELGSGKEKQKTSGSKAEA
mmetsp:Transcript_33791/g.61286  ORF Transcript_33791/g.61286 Transcript_33791/m.61286 type:complete len:219 (-) Transcript_33791:95-751(-)